MQFSCWGYKLFWGEIKALLRNISFAFGITIAISPAKIRKKKEKLFF